MGPQAQEQCTACAPLDTYRSVFVCLRTSSSSLYGLYPAAGSQHRGLQDPEKNPSTPLPCSLSFIIKASVCCLGMTGPQLPLDLSCG